MKTIFRKIIRIKNKKPFEVGLQILLGVPFYKDEPQTLTTFRRITAKGTTYYSFWIIDIIHLWWEY